MDRNQLFVYQYVQCVNYESITRTYITASLEQAKQLNAKRPGFESNPNRNPEDIDESWSELGPFQPGFISEIYADG